jgi:dihydrofolate synthase / folylpolyglutamate synthase
MAFFWWKLHLLWQESIWIAASFVRTIGVRRILSSLIFAPMKNAYNETIQLLYSQLPVYHHIGPAAYKKDLTNTLELCALLDNPQRKFKSIHVAGTNGKGSSSHMLAAILQTAGYKTGLYTSPHLKDFSERIKINGTEIKKDFVVAFAAKMQSAMEKIRPSFFELTVAMAFEYFAQEKVDIAVIEVGLGGRLDSTNIIDPEVSLITNIGFDHMDILGDTLPEIASEKAGIIKPGRPVIISERQPEVENVFIAKAKESASPICFASDLVTAKKFDNGNVIVQWQLGKDSLTLSPALKGLYQLKNIKGVVQAVLILKTLGYTISDESVVVGINNTTDLTGLKGRWQKINDRPLTICDTAHNAEGLSEIVKQIKITPYKNLKWVLGMVSDKPHEKILSFLPTDAQYYFCQAKIPRAMDAEKLSHLAARFGLKGKVVRDVNEALNTARKESSEDDLIMVGGSTFVVGEVEAI